MNGGGKDPVSGAELFIQGRKAALIQFLQQPVFYTLCRRRNFCNAPEKGINIKAGAARDEGDFSPPGYFTGCPESLPAEIPGCKLTVGIYDIDEIMPDFFTDFPPRFAASDIKIFIDLN